MPSLRVLAGPSLEKVEDITHLVNSKKPYTVSSDSFNGDISVHLKGFNSDSGEDSGAYFSRPDREGITWSIQAQGSFTDPVSANDVYFGNIFERSLNLPYGSGAVLKFMSYIDPTMQHDLNSSTKPWALSPLISTMPHISIRNKSEEKPEFPILKPLPDDTANLELDDLSTDATAAVRRSFFSTAENRKRVTLGSDRVITLDFCYGYLQFIPTLALQLPVGGLSFNLDHYWDGQPVRFVCCEKGESGGAGKIFFCIVIERAPDL